MATSERGAAGSSALTFDLFLKLFPNKAPQPNVRSRYRLSNAGNGETAGSGCKVRPFEPSVPDHAARCLRWPVREGAIRRRAKLRTAVQGRSRLTARRHALDFAKGAICALLPLVHSAARTTAQVGDECRLFTVRTNDRSSADECLQTALRVERQTTVANGRKETLIATTQAVAELPRSGH